MSCEEAKLPPHVLIFPLPAQGHINSMLNLAHLFCLAEFHVTFIVSEFSHRRLLEHVTLSRLPRFIFRALPDGLPDDHPRAGEKIMDMIPSVINIMMTSFKQIMIKEDFMASAGRRPVTCIVADGTVSAVGEFAEENGIPLVYFPTTSAGYFWSIYHYHELIQAQEFPFRENTMDELVKSIPGMESFLRRRDLPSFYRVDDVNEPTIKIQSDVTRQTIRGQAAIFNTCEELEGTIVTQIQNHMPIKIYSIGPIHEQLKSRLLQEKAEASIVSASLWAEDRSCIDWLNSQPRKSVIYVSFGSITVLSRKKLLEIWHGLVNSLQKFLRVIRPNSILLGKDENDKVLLDEGMKENGLIVEWAPQEEVLNHPSVSAFLTHSGWNSTLESIAAGVPMICWPYMGDQMVNSRFVSEVWKIGLDIKDTCDRLTVEKAIREVMEVRKEEFQKRADDLAKNVKKVDGKGSSSYANLDGLNDYIKSLID